ncbi:MAG: PTS sugar transporter subunit IIB [Fusobacteriaceae bacterium]
MKKVLLICAAGMSTSILVNKMRESAKTRGIEVEIEAVASDLFSDNLEKYDVFLLGPQIRFKKDEFAKEAARLGKPLDVINTMDYGMMKGEKVLDFALSLIK